MWFFERAGKDGHGLPSDARNSRIHVNISPVAVEVAESQGLLLIPAFCTSLKCTACCAPLSSFGTGAASSILQPQPLVYCHQHCWSPAQSYKPVSVDSKITLFGLHVSGMETLSCTIGEPQEFQELEGDRQMCHLLLIAAGTGCQPGCPVGFSGHVGGYRALA